MRTFASLAVLVIISGLSSAYGFDAAYRGGYNSEWIFEASDRPDAEWRVVNVFRSDVSWTFADPHILEVDWGFADPHILDVDWGFATPNAVSAQWFMQDPVPSGQFQFPAFGDPQTGRP